uniref:ABC transporter permease n=1 Tax=uncultured Draconibacterium sp. TaxID=1573823 RepID=UPI0032168B9F
MFKNFIKIAWRHFTKNPVITAIQVFGLTIGLTVFFLILLWVNNQISFDRFNTKADQIYRLEYYSDDFDGMVEMNLAMGPQLANHVSAVDKFVRIRSAWGGRLRLGEQDTPGFKEARFNNFIWADSTFFSVFTFNFIYGDPEKCLLTAQDVVIAESLAKKLFGNEYPIGKQIYYMGPKTVSGVYKDVNNFHLPFDVVLPFAHLKQFYKFAEVGFEWDSWKSMRLHTTYFLLHKNSDSKVASQQMTDFFREIQQNVYDDPNPNSELRLKPLKRIYFFGKTPKEFSYVLHGNLRLILGLAMIALLILLLAIANFVNLNFTRTFKRAKEVGIRKVVGSNSNGIFYLFIGETILLALVTLILTLLLLQLVLPYYNQLISADLSIRELLNKYNLFSGGLSFVLIFLFAGILPSIYISSVGALKAIRSFELRNSAKGIFLRKTFLIIQYGITIIVIASTLIVQKQVSFMKNSDPGFEMENVYVSGYFYDLDKSDSKKQWVKTRLLENPNIEKVVFCHSAPPSTEPSYGTLEINGKKIQTHDVYTHPGYFDLLEVPILEGRDFSYDIKADQAGTEANSFRIIMNETAVKQYNLVNPVGTIGTVQAFHANAEIIGVVKDFHIKSLKSSIPPIVFIYHPMTYSILIKNNGGTFEQLNEFVNQVFQEAFTRNTSVYNLSDRYNRQYNSENQLGKLFLWFSLISVLIAALGLYGISANAIQRRVKEIGIRKVHGASSWTIMKLIQGYFARIVIWAGVIALPVSWFFMSKWLLNYPYKTEMSWWIFMISLVFALFIAMSTISWRIWKAATGNPVNAIKYE